SGVRKGMKIEPADFDKEFLAWVEADTKKTVEHFDEWKKTLKSLVEMSATKDWDTVIKQGTAIRDMYPDYVEEHSVYEILATAYTAKGNKAAATAELERYSKIGGRDPDSLKPPAKPLEGAGRKKACARGVERMN